VYRAIAIAQDGAVQGQELSGENVLSLDVMRKAEEMEKLARQIKINMRGQ
jgi:hypothetical protein